MKEKKQITVCGAFDIGSVGDEAALMFLRKILPESHYKITVLTRKANPKYGEFQKVEVAPKLEYPTAGEARGRNFRGFNPDEKLDEVKPLIELLKNTDLLLLGPGSFMNGQHDRMFRGALQEMWAMSLLADMAECPYMIWGASSNILENTVLVDMLKSLVKRSLQTTFRDILSLKNVYMYGAVGNLQAFPDPVLGWSELPSKELVKGSKRDLVVFSVRDVSHMADQKNYVDAIAHAILYLTVRKKKRVRFAPHFVDGSGRDDWAVITQILDKLKSISGYELEKDQISVAVTLPEWLEETYLKAEVVVGTRLHSCVMAVRCGAPIVPISYDPKIEGFVSEMGKDPFEVIPAEVVTTEKILGKIENPMVIPRETVETEYKILVGEYCKLFNDYICAGVM